MDLTNFLVAELAKSFGFPCKNGDAESLGDFRYALSPRHWAERRETVAAVGSHDDFDISLPAGFTAFICNNSTPRQNAIAK